MPTISLNSEYELNSSKVVARAVHYSQIIIHRLSLGEYWLHFSARNPFWWQDYMTGLDGRVDKKSDK